MANEVTQVNVATGETITRDYTQEEKDAIASYPSNTTEKKWVRIRSQRDMLLRECDWWASSDVTMSDAQTAYRQALRDLPASKSNPDDIVYPSKP
jgi:hypothetical protein